ncbi:hypothetical protein A3L02_03740 [Thermococcus celer Vu 13 = JCM 8558]|uniref:Uncharacterized protein n=1 Tax=Thermococcus celer Vu 13 = JCM 8558 TaxID=1293037 RepID=A0A218P1F4_THECE|nr:hypothetical protein A3L02_03740 [Thermococcus celer Vu 13 = JCM 8558]
MEERDKRLIEYSVEAVIMAWLAYLFFYQNFLLYRWHRGLPLPSRWPFALLGIVTGGMFLWYELVKLERELETEGETRPPVARSIAPNGGEKEGGEDPGDGEDGDVTVKKGG